MYAYVRVHTCLYDFIMIHTGMYKYVPVHTYIRKTILVHTGMYEYIKVQTCIDRIMMSYKKEQTGLEPEIFNKIFAEHAAALQVCTLSTGAGNYCAAMDVYLDSAY